MEREQPEANKRDWQTYIQWLKESLEVNPEVYDLTNLEAETRIKSKDIQP